MPKRRAVTVDSDTEPESSQAPKRARTDGNGTQLPALRSKGKARRTAEEEGEDVKATDANNDNDELIVVDEEEEELEEAPVNAADEKKFEELHEDDIRGRLMNAQKIQGVSDHFFSCTDV